jgi:radical SAM superfamily enzyme YgiQ (UPF0313 family)
MFTIALVAPIYEDKYKKIDSKSRENLSIAYLAAYLEKNNYAVDMINAHYRRWDSVDVLEHLKSNECNLLGISCTSQKCYSNSKELVQLIKKEFAHLPIVMGGIFPSMEYELIMNDIPELDFIVVGEGEISLTLLCDQISESKNDFDIPGLVFRTDTGVAVNKNCRIHDLDSLPFPKREKLDYAKMERPMLRMLAGRGCYGNCAFCSIQDSYVSKGKIYRSAKNIIDEIEMLVNNEGITFFAFFDDIFYDLSQRGKEWVLNFSNEIRKRSLKIKFRIELRTNDVSEKEIALLKEVGLESIYLGVESGVQRLLDEMKKNITVEDNIKAIEIIKNHELEILLGFITFIPTMTFEELIQNYDFLFKTKVYNEENLYNRLNIYNGCAYEATLQKKGLLCEKSSFWERHNYKYKDEKVHSFYEMLSKIRLRLVSVREKINIVKLTSTYSEIKEVEKYNLTMWEQLIKILLDLFCMRHSEEKIPLEIEKKIQDFECKIGDYLHE